MRGLVKQWVLGVLALGFVAGPALGGVTLTGDTKDDGSFFAAGYSANATGSLVIDSGSVFNRSSGSLGYAIGSNGSAIVTGAGSQWNTSNELDIGYYGLGTLLLQAGGLAASGSSNLGFNSGSSGAVTVSGTGSRWTNAGTLYLGFSGSGTLTVSDGGLVSTKTLYASLSDLHGDGTISVQSGGILDADLVFDASNSTTAAFGSGGTLQLIVDGTSELGVGFKQSGSLRIADGRSIASSSGNLGYGVGSTGTAIITGAGSKWINSGWLFVGNSGAGTLTVSDGGVVSAKTLYASLSDLHGNGTITASGAVLDADLVFDASHNGTVAFGSSGTLQLSLDGTGALGAGYRRSGSLRIADGSAVTSSAGYVGYRSGSTGTAIVSGVGSKWTTGHLLVGGSGSGALNVEAGAQVSSSNGEIGAGFGSSGAVTVTGTGSRWTNSGALYVAGYDLASYADSGTGSGTLTVSDGGVVSTNVLYASPSDLHGSGTITVQSGGILDTDLIFDATHGTTQALAFGAGGTLQIAVDGKNLLGTGYKQSGSLRIADGRSVSSTDGVLGYFSGSTGSATVSGAGSKWTNSGWLYVGRSGTGTLRVEAAGQLVTSASSANGYLGFNSGSSGEVIVSGTGSKWTSGSGNLYLYIGNSGSGALRVEAGGQVSNNTSSLARGPGSIGIATVTGAGSQWINSSTLSVGSSGSGTLKVEAGGQVSNTSGYLGYNSGSSGTATVTGTGSQWTNTGFTVGYSGRGMLRVEAGGQVGSTTGTLGYNAGSWGTATVTGAGSKWTNSSTVYVGRNGSGTLAVSDGGQVTGTTLSVGNNDSIMRLHVSGDNMLLLGSSSSTGKVTDNGQIEFLADAMLPAGVYRPIGEYAGRNLGWSGTGSTVAVGGMWDSAAKTFTVVAPTAVDAGVAAAVGSGQRLLIVGAAGGASPAEAVGGAHPTLGVSFGMLTSGTNLTASLLSSSESAALLPLLGPGETILSGWDFFGPLAGGEALLSFDVGLGASGLRLWRFSQNAWSAYTPQMMTYDSHGVVSFTVDPASLDAAGYAVTVPEPAMICLLALAGLRLLRRGRTRPRA